MTYLSAFKTGNLVLPSALLFHYKDIFHSSDEFVLWQFFYLQNTTGLGELSIQKISESFGKSISEVNQLMNLLTEQGLLEFKTIELNGEIEVLFDASPVLSRLDELLTLPKEKIETKPAVNQLADLVATFEQELGRPLSPFEIEDLTKTVKEDHTDVALIKEALREAVFNGKANWKYIQAIIRNWRREGITTVAQVQMKKDEREASNPQSVTVSEDFLNAMNLWKE